MNGLSKEAERTLISAIERAANYVNSGLSPNDAIIKSASETNVPAGHINLMVHAYNTGRTTKQREQGESTLEKAADFPLADAATVAAALYPKTVKTAAELHQQHVVSTEYAISPAGMLARRKSQLNKAAAATVELPKTEYVPYPRDEQLAAEHAYSAAKAEKLAHEEQRRKATAAYQKAAVAMDALADFFRHPGNMSFNDAVAQVSLRFGESGVSVLNKVAEVYPQFKKQAATKNLHIGHNAVYDLVASVVSNIEDYVDEKGRVIEKKATDFSKKSAPPFTTDSILTEVEPLLLKEAARPPSPPKPPKTPPTFSDRLNSVAGKYRDNLVDSWIKQPSPPARSPSQYGGVFGPTKAVGEIMGSVVKDGPKDTYGMWGANEGLDKDPAKLQRNSFNTLSAPEHELQLKNIHAQATLHDLMTNDPVISGYDPHEVANAFNEVADIAPNVVQSPAVLSSVLRKRLAAGSFADFDAKQLIEMDKLKAERDEKMLAIRAHEQELI